MECSAFKKVTQSLNYFAAKQGGSINKMKALKLLFLADRYHFRKYGRLITDDTYYAMRNGPVPSRAKDSAEGKHCLTDRLQNYSVQYIMPTDIHHFKSIKDPDMRVLSQSDEEALSFAWNMFGHLGQFELVTLTHNYPEWQRRKKYLTPNKKRVLMDVVDFLEDPHESVEPCFTLYDEDRVIRRQHRTETARLEAIWG